MHKLLLALFSTALFSYFVLSSKDDVKPETWKLLNIASAKSKAVVAKKRYNCTGLIEELSEFDVNVTDCTLNRGNLWYRIDDLMNWEQSWNACRLILGSDLASIHNVDDFNLLRYLFWMPDQDHTANWIGLNDILEENNFRWSDGRAFDYRRWLAPMKEPNGDSEENCVMYQSQVAGGGCCWADGLLDFRCSHELPAICKLRNPRSH